MSATAPVVPPSTAYGRLTSHQPLRLLLLGLTSTLLAVPLCLHLGWERQLMLQPLRAAPASPSDSFKWLSDPVNADHSLLLPPWTDLAAAAGPLAADRCLLSSHNTSALPELTLEAAWRSQLPRSSQGITLVVQLSLLRLDRLLLSADLFPGAISAAVYAPLLGGKLVDDGVVSNVTLPELISQVSAVHAELEHRGSTRVDIAVYSETLTSMQQSYYYPFNSLRNRALLAAETDAVLVLDVDGIVSMNLSHSEHIGGILTAVRQHKGVVVPIFRTRGDGETGRQQALAAVAGGKHVAVTMLEAGIIHQSYVKQANFAHADENITRWMTAADFYSIDEYHERFEPYVIVAREHAPLYDERFTGPEMDKVVYTHTLCGAGYELLVNPTEFIVHVPHEPSHLAAKIHRLEWEGAGQYLYQRLLLLQEVMGAVANHTYAPPTAFSCLS